jgi:hypothetical protein
MTNPSASNPSAFPLLTDGAIVYRLARSKSWLDTDNSAFTPAAFLRRRDECGLSVSIAVACSLEYAIAGAGVLHKCYGVAELQVGPIKSVGLDVLPDAVDHAEIVGMPTVDEDIARANYFADLLAEQTRLLWPK